MGRKVLFIYNPHAGKARIRNCLSDIIDIFARSGYDIAVHSTQGKRDATVMVRNMSPDVELLVCSGGDGTLDEIVSGMLLREKKVPIGYIPAGSTNDFAKSLCIPRNMCKAAKMIVEGRRFPCDIGIFNKKSFVYAAAFGAVADVAYETTQAAKKILGYFAYVVGAFLKIPKIKAYHLKIYYDGNELEGDFALGIVSNSFSVGGFNNVVGSDIELDDGLFEMTLIELPAGIQDLGTIVRVLMGFRAEGAMIHHFRAKSIKLVSKERLPWTLDGEYGGRHREASIRVLKQALDFVVPLDAPFPSEGDIAEAEF